jgi:hypothetical protein
MKSRRRSAFRSRFVGSDRDCSRSTGKSEVNVSACQLFSSEASASRAVINTMMDVSSEAKHGVEQDCDATFVSTSGSVCGLFIGSRGVNP